MVVMPVIGCPPSNHPLLNVDKPVVGRLTVWWCANTWLGVHFVMVGAYLLLGEGNNKKRNPRVHGFEKTLAKSLSLVNSQTQWYLALSEKSPSLQLVEQKSFSEYLDKKS